MTKEKKPKLSEMKVQSFVTSLDKDVQKKIVAGSGTTTPGGTSIPVFCM